MMARAIGMTFAIAAVSLLAAPASLSALESERAVGAAREGLQGRPHFPWYDSQTDGLRRIDVAPPPPPPKASNWQPKPATQPTRSWSLGAVFWGILEVLAWIVIVALFLLVILLLVQAFLRRESRSAVAASDDEAIGRESDVDRVEDLPFRVRRPRSDLLTEARRQYEMGNYGEAVIYLFSYQLVQLDENQLIRLTRGKTNRQYLREIRRQATLYEMLQMTMIAFEDVFFGNHRLDRARFEACWNRLDEFHGQVQGVPV